jgi:hypothetical protein
MFRVGGRRAVAGALLAGGAWIAQACSSSSSQRNVIVNGDGSAGSPGGTSGAGGRGGANGSGGSSGSAGTNGRGGTSGSAGTNGSGGSSGSAGTDGSGGSTGGTSGGPVDASGGSSGSPPEDAGDAAPDSGGGNAVPIQRIQDGTVAAGQTARVEKVFVTAFRQTVGGELSFIVQEPQGDTQPPHIYPDYAGLSVFIRVDGGSVTPPAVGDCVDVTGLVEEFQGRTQLTDGSFAKATNCGTFPAPMEIPSLRASFADVATDSDSSAPDNQPGAKAEVFESVLVRVSAVRVLSAPSTFRFDIAQQASPSGAMLIVQGVYHSQNPPVGQNYAAITGIMSDASGEYRLLPRSAADFFQ